MARGEIGARVRNEVTSAQILDRRSGGFKGNKGRNLSWH